MKQKLVFQAEWDKDRNSPKSPAGSMLTSRYLLRAVLQYWPTWAAMPLGHRVENGELATCHNDCLPQKCAT